MARGKFKMRGGALSCPPGVHCLDTNTMLLYILVGLAVVAILIFVLKHYGFFGSTETKPTVVVVQTKQRESPMPPITISQQDPRFNPAPPERTYNTAPDLRGFPTFNAGTTPINQPTSGYPQSYQQIGVLTTPGGTETSGSPTRTILPLFGRKLATNRDRWNYYTRTDGINPVQVPLQFKRRNCDDDLGCEEINDGDSIGVPIMGQSFTASVYRNSTPRYIPNI
jgi:hypothetical protein